MHNASASSGGKAVLVAIQGQEQMTTRTSMVTSGEDVVEPGFAARFRLK